MIIPEKLKPNDEIRVLSPSSNFQRVGGMEGNRKAQERLESLGYKVTFSKNIHATDLIGSASIEERVEDLHAAFSDHNVKAILSTIGGFNSNELLPYIDYDLIRSNPKIICGYSDITALNNAITAKTGLVTYIGPHYSSFKMDELQDYQTEYFLKVCAGREEVQLAASDHYSDDLWFLPEEPRNLVENAWKVYTPGTAEGLAMWAISIPSPCSREPSICQISITESFLSNPQKRTRPMTSPVIWRPCSRLPKIQRDW